MSTNTIKYAELNCLSNFTFLKSASHPQELVEQAAINGYYAIALTDECSFAGIVKAHFAAKKCGVKFIVGTVLKLIEGPEIILLVNSISSYKEISKLITKARRSQVKGSYQLSLNDLIKIKNGLIIWKTSRQNIDIRFAILLKKYFKDRLWLGVGNFYEEGEKEFQKLVYYFSDFLSIPVTAIGDVRMHKYRRRYLFDTLTAIRQKLKIENIETHSFSNAERYLRSLQRIANMYPKKLLEETIRIADKCDFSLDDIEHNYPDDDVPQSYGPTSYLRYLTELGLKKRWPKGVPKRIIKLVKYELDLIQELKYEGFFITVENIVSFAKKKGILCQGRGSAANSVVCYCLGITEVDPSKVEVLFERFLSKERDEPPDIDVDFEHERREEVIQYIYQKYGRSNAALVSSIVKYKRKSAIRDVGKVLGFSQEQIQILTKIKIKNPNKESQPFLEENNRRITILNKMVNELIGFPRHLSQHVGGFAISKKPLTELVPIENAAMLNRTVIQWDKRDLESIGIIKIDCLGLGMLSVIRKSLDLISEINGEKTTLSDVPNADLATYKMIQRAETIGVFQIESRAQMAMLPRLKPACYYDLVIEIALIRPGPIQGNMVHPYLKRRKGEEKPFYPNKEIREVLKRTLGVPLFQEQVIKLAVVAAGFQPGEAEMLRRTITSWDDDTLIDSFYERFINGMLERGYSKDYAESLFEQIRGFGGYGFPESHAASFALLAYVSSWIKCHYPAIFTASLLNSQPMGFYSTSQLIRDCLGSGVEIKNIDILKSDWDCSIGNNEKNQIFIQLGFRLIKGLSKKVVELIIAERQKHPFLDIFEFKQRVDISKDQLKILISSGVLNDISKNRYVAAWNAMRRQYSGKLFAHITPNDKDVIPMIKPPTAFDNMLSDYQTRGFTLGKHPIAFLRERKDLNFFLTASCLSKIKSICEVRVIGLVINRQKPQTASGVVFLTLEDETGLINLIIWPNILRNFEDAILNATILRVTGKLENSEKVSYVIPSFIEDCSHLLDKMKNKSRDFH